MNHLIQPDQPTAVIVGATLAELGQAANQVASGATFKRELQAKSENTRSAYQADLQTWVAYLISIRAAGVKECDFYDAPACWAGVTYGLVLAYVEWLKRQGFAIASINRKLACVRQFCAMASQAGVIAPGDLALIQTVRTIRRGAGMEIDRQRSQARIDRPQAKKAKSVELTVEQAEALKSQPEGSQGRRDGLLMCLLLDHGLRAGEVVTLQLVNFDLRQGLLTFWREKVDKEQKHRLTPDTLAALRAYIDAGDAPALGPILRASLKSGKLGKVGMTARSITRRVKELGEMMGIERLSAHDCRHFWATDAQRSGSDPFILQQAGGWTSMATVQRYVEAAKVANEGLKQSTGKKRADASLTTN